MTKSRELDEVQSRNVDVNKRHYGEDVKFYPQYITKDLLQNCNFRAALDKGYKNRSSLKMDALYTPWK